MQTTGDCCRLQSCALPAKLRRLIALPGSFDINIVQVGYVTTRHRKEHRPCPSWVVSLDFVVHIAGDDGCHNRSRVHSKWVCEERIYE